MSWNRKLCRPPTFDEIVEFGARWAFRWYDLWIGAFWDREALTLYVCPVPTLGIKIVFAGAQA